MNSLFQFKQFTVEQNHASMKVGTDGVLLGAWAPVENSNTILDIGTGTGLIALMIAQRNANASITAIEVDEDACLDAEANFRNSPWNKSLNLICDNLQNYQPPDKFDLIISNPPFFKNSLLSTGYSRNQARHDQHLSPKNIFAFTSNNLHEHGSLCLVYPADRLEELNTNAELSALYLNSCCYIKPTPLKDAHRVLLNYKKRLPAFKHVSELVIEDRGRHQFSNKYIELTKDFYLAF